VFLFVLSRSNKIQYYSRRWASDVLTVSDMHRVVKICRLPLAVHGLFRCSCHDIGLLMTWYIISENRKVDCDFEFGDDTQASS